MLVPGQHAGMASLDLAALAAQFDLDGAVCSLEPLGNGNVNTTYRVRTTRGVDYVLQRLNTVVFSRPDLVMANLLAVTQHAATRLRGPTPSTRPAWQLPRPVALKAAAADSRLGAAQACLLVAEGDPWRVLTYIDGAHSIDVIGDCNQAAEVGRALGWFHALIHDLPPTQLADTLEGFHVTPRYHQHYLEQLGSFDNGVQHLDPQEVTCIDFIAAREDLVPVLEQARAKGLLQLRPIHGDPKVNNVMLCASSGCAVAMVDLDTVKPGLIHYDIGDALRSGCNQAGEEATDLATVRFDIELARAMLAGYWSEAGSLLSEHDIDYLYDAIRLLPFELGLRFFSDHLAGNVYFKVGRPRHNLDRALVQFKLTQSIEAQEGSIRQLIAELSQR